MARGYGPGSLGEYGGGPGNQPGEPGGRDGGGETARERGIRTAATAPDRERATTGGRAERQAVARARENRNAWGALSFIPDVARDLKDKVAERVGIGPLSFTKEGLNQAVEQGIASLPDNFMFGLGKAAAEMTGMVNERMIAAGHRPGEVAGVSFRGQTPETDDWGGYVSARDAHDAERGPPAVRTPMTGTPTDEVAPEPESPEAVAQSIIDEYDAIGALESVARSERRSPRARQTKRQAVATAMAQAEIRGAAQGTLGTY